MSCHYRDVDGNPCGACKQCIAESDCVAKLRASQKRERALFAVIKKNCGYPDHYCKKCQLRACPLLNKKGGGKQDA